MKQYTIEIDEIIMNYLKDKAEPFVDTPNTVLHKLLFDNILSHEKPNVLALNFNENMPKALSQILEVIKEVVNNKLSRPEATRIVAERNNTAPQTIIDKYCRQLGKKANEIDKLLNESGLAGFRIILMNKFPKHEEIIVSFFNDLQKGGEKMDHVRQQGDFKGSKARIHREYSISSSRKKRDTALEAALKNALGKKLKDQFGPFTLKGQSQLIFNGARVLCKFSSFHSDQSRWFWGVSKIYWQSWELIDYLALIMENENGDRHSYILMDSKEAQTLFDACSESAGEKKINMRIYMDDEIVRFQEWKEFDAEKRLLPLELI